MSDVPPTRMNQQVFKLKLKAAEGGHRLLKKKADALKVRLFPARRSESMQEGRKRRGVMCSDGAVVKNKCWDVLRCAALCCAMGAGQDGESFMAENAIGSVLGRVVGADAGVLAAGILSAQRVLCWPHRKALGTPPASHFAPYSSSHPHTHAQLLTLSTHMRINLYPPPHTSPFFSGKIP